MIDKLSVRLETLRDELQSGRQMEAELEDKLVQLRATLLRIGGAIQVLEELLEQEDLSEPQRDDPKREPTGAQQ
jgi:hypothetical protein